MRFLNLTITILLLPTSTLAADFSVELLKPVEGLRQCQVMFSQVPSKARVDSIMDAALRLCTSVDDSHDVQVMAFKGDDALDEKYQSYTYLVYDHRKRTTKRVTFNEFLSGLKPIK